MRTEVHELIGILRQLEADPRIGRFGLCIFSSMRERQVINRKLNTAFGDSGDNLSIFLGPKHGNWITHVAGNYAQAPLPHAIGTIEIIAESDDGFVLVTDGYVGGPFKAKSIAIVRSQNVVLTAGREYSFDSFTYGLLQYDRMDYDPRADISTQALENLTICALYIPPTGGNRLLPQSQTLLAPAWDALADQIMRNPDILNEFSRQPRLFEELIAGTYEKLGYKVTLTPRSGDGGVDVIAEKRGEGAMLILDQAKALRHNRRVAANDVRAVMGTLWNHPAASKAVISTTSQFAPGVSKEFEKFTPTRLELRDRDEVLKWIGSAKSSPFPF